MNNPLEKYIHQYFSISVADAEKMAELFKPERIPKGEYFLKSGRYCNKLSFIHEGMFRVYVSLPDREVTQWIGTAGYFITDLSGFMFRNLSRWNIQALADSSIYTIHHEQYLQLGKLIPQWHELEKLFIGKCFITLENRIFDQISLSAEERYQLLFDSQRDLLTGVPLQYLASMLGMTPETFSRIRRKHIS